MLVAAATEHIQIGGGFSAFAHFSDFKGMDIELLPEGTRAAARYLRTGYDMTNHGVAAGGHAQAFDAEFIHRFGIAGPIDEAIRDAGVDFVRIVPGSRDMPRDVGALSIQALAKMATRFRDAS